MRLITSILLINLTTILSCHSQQNVTPKNPDTFVNLDKNGVIIRGYDVVAFFTEGKSIKGDPAFQSTLNGAKYQFSSKKNQQIFDANPEKYKVQFGGWCAYAVSKGSIASINIDTWSIQDGRLLFQYNKSIAKKWATSPEANLEKADKNWPVVAGNHQK